MVQFIAAQQGMDFWEKNKSWIIPTVIGAIAACILSCVIASCVNSAKKTDSFTNIGSVRINKDDDKLNSGLVNAVSANM